MRRSTQDAPVLPLHCTWRGGSYNSMDVYFYTYTTSPAISIMLLDASVLPGKYLITVLI